MLMIKTTCASLAAVALTYITIPSLAVPISPFQEVTSAVPRQAPYDAYNPPPSSMLLHGRRGLVDDTLRGLLGGLSILPGVVELSDILVGDGKKSKGLLGSLGGLLLDVQPSDSSSNDSGNNSTSTSSDDDASHNQNGSAQQAAQQSYRYTLQTSKKQSSQVFLMPVRQAKASVGNDTMGESEGGSEGGSATSQADGNEAMLVKMLLHTLDGHGTPMVMCASYGDTPPTDLGVSSCTSDGDDADGATSSSTSTTTNATAGAEGQHQLFRYTPSTGDLSPIFRKQMDEDSVSSNTTTGSMANATESADGAQSNKATTTIKGAQKEMRMRFKPATFVTADNGEPPSDDEDDTEPTSSSPSSTEATETATMTAESTLPTPTGTSEKQAIKSSSRRITLGRTLVQSTADDDTADEGGADAEEGQDTSDVTNEQDSCDDESEVDPNGDPSPASTPAQAKTATESQENEDNGEPSSSTSETQPSATSAAAEAQSTDTAGEATPSPAEAKAATDQPDGAEDSALSSQPTLSTSSSIAQPTESAITE